MNKKLSNVSYAYFKFIMEVIQENINNVFLNIISIIKQNLQFIANM